MTPQSMRATVAKHHEPPTLPVIRATIAESENDVGIRISDEGEQVIDLLDSLVPCSIQAVAWSLPITQYKTLRTSFPFLMCAMLLGWKIPVWVLCDPSAPARKESGQQLVNKLEDGKAALCTR